MPFGVVSGVGRGMVVLDGWRSSKGRGSLGNKYATRFLVNYVIHCNQWYSLREGRRRHDAALPKLLWDFLLSVVFCTLSGLGLLFVYQMHADDYNIRIH